MIVEVLKKPLMISAFVFVLMLTIEIRQNPLGLLILAHLIGMIADLGS